MTFFDIGYDLIDTTYVIDEVSDTMSIKVGVIDFVFDVFDIFLDAVDEVHLLLYAVARNDEDKEIKVPPCECGERFPHVSRSKGEEK